MNVCVPVEHVNMRGRRECGHSRPKSKTSSTCAQELKDKSERSGGGGDSNMTPLKRRRKIIVKKTKKKTLEKKEK